MLAIRVLVCALFASPMIASAQSLQDVRNELQSGFDKLKSFSARRIEKSNVSYGEMSQLMERTGTWEWMRGAKNDLLRIELQGGFKTRMSAAIEQKGPIRSLEVWDEKYHYQFEDRAGVKRAGKEDLVHQARQQVTDFGVFSDDGAKLLPPDKFDGADVVVVETPQLASAPTAVKVRRLFRKDCGLRVRMVALDAEGKEIALHELRDIKLNAEVAPDRFEFQAPEGVKVTDTSTP